MKKDTLKLMLAAAVLTVAGVSYTLCTRNAGAIALSSFGQPATQTVVSESNTDRQSADVSQSGNAGQSGDESSADSLTGIADSSQAAGAAEKEEETAAGVLVYVCGEVAAPGVYELREGSRIYEAIEAAGGFTEAAAQKALNLAAPVSDGLQITVYTEEEAATAPAGVSAGGEGGAAGAGAGVRINLNTASSQELMQLTGIGESRAADIIRYREENGRFQKIEDIMKVPGIKDAGFQKIKDRITV